MIFTTYKWKRLDFHQDGHRRYWINALMSIFLCSLKAQRYVFCHAKYQLTAVNSEVTVNNEDLNAP